MPLVATPNAGYELAAWSGDCTGNGACSVTMTANRGVGATSQSKQFTLTVAIPANGTITGEGINCDPAGMDCTQTYAYGTVVPLVATPNTGYELAAWSGDCTGNGPCSVAMDAPRSVAASFTIQQFTLTVAIPANGTITGEGISCDPAGTDCTQTYAYGTVVPLVATPNTGYELAAWSVATARATGRAR